MGRPRRALRDPPWLDGARARQNCASRVQIVPNELANGAPGTCAKNVIDLSEAFNRSVVEALRNVFDDIEEAPSPVPDDAVKVRKTKGVIVVRGGDIVGRVLVEAGVLRSHVNASATFSASVFVGIRKTRVLEAAIDGSSAAEGDMRRMCAGGEKTLTDVSAAAMQDTVKKLTNLLSNAQYLRTEK